MMKKAEAEEEKKKGKLLGAACPTGRRQSFGRGRRGDIENCGLGTIL